MNILKGKRLLLLGGSLWKEAIQSYAKEKGIVLIATGNDTSAGIFQIASESYNVDSTDEVAMKHLIREKKIDGVYMGGSEAVCSIACKYLNEMKLPCYCTKEQWDFLENKENFKTLCEEVGLPVAKKYSISDMEEGKNIDFPVITKPTDGSGSNGFSVCNNLEELRKGYKIAQNVSPSGSVLIEKFVKNDSVVVFYTFSNGKMYFCGLEEKFPIRYEKQGRYVAGAHVFESNATDEFRKKFEKKLEILFEKIGIKEGPIWIEVFHDNDKYYFNEVGYRYSGSVSIYPIDYFYHINQVAADINFALTGNDYISEECGYQSLITSKVKRKSKYCIYSIHVNPGEIKEVIGINEMRDRDTVVAIPEAKSIGDIVAASGTVGQVYAFVHFVFDTEEELIEMINSIHETIKIIDTEGENLVKKMVDLEQIKKRFWLSV